MIRDRIRAWLDNPIFVKHARSRLRTQSLMTAIVVVQALCLCIVWAGYQLGSLASGRTFSLLYLLQIVILIVMGGAQVGTALGNSRASGILDFHRVSPLSASALSLGFFFGAPIREYVLFATTLPYAVLCVAFDQPYPHEFIQWMILLIVTAWVFHGLALLHGLVSKPRTSSRGVVGLVVFIFVVLSNFIFSIRRIGVGVDLWARWSFYGKDLPWLAVVVMHEAVLLFFIYLGSTRRMASERSHLLSKPQAAAAMAALALLLMGDAWKHEANPVFMLTVLYVPVVTAVVLIMMVTPSKAEFIKGLWRAHKQGRSRLSSWDDLSLNRVFLAIACAVVLITTTFAWDVVSPLTIPIYGSDLRGYPMGIATGVLVVGYFGLAMQYFNLRFENRGTMYFGLFLFLAWLLPLVGGTIVSMASWFGNDNTLGQIVFSLSPMAGISMSAAGSDDRKVTEVLSGRSHHSGTFLHVCVQQPADRRPPARAQAICGRRRQNRGAQRSGSASSGRPGSRVMVRISQGQK